jgi:hypothetical protein
VPSQNSSHCANSLRKQEVDPTSHLLASILVSSTDASPRPIGVRAHWHSAHPEIFAALCAERGARVVQVSAK